MLIPLLTSPRIFCYTFQQRGDFMQKHLSLLIAFTLFISMVGCSKAPEDSTSNTTVTTTETTQNPSVTGAISDTDATTHANTSDTDTTSAVSNTQHTTKSTNKSVSTKKKTTTTKNTAADDEPTYPEKVIKVYPFDTSFPNVKVKKDVYNDPKNGNSLPYHLYFPKDYDPQKKYPLLIALHGAGEIGSDNKSQLNNMKNLFNCNGDLLAQGFVLCPQSNAWWNLDYAEDGDEGGTLGSVLHLLEDLQDTYSIYKNRIYVTGLSMGGYATWDLLQDYGHLFAAGIPICGGGNASKATALKNIPIKIYHSLDDDTVHFNSSQKMYDAITAAGGKKVEFIQLDGIGHAAWDYAYADREAISWLYSQEKTENASGNYTYRPYFTVRNSNGDAIITEEDFDNLYYTISYEGDTLIYTVELLLNDAGMAKLNKAYAKKSTFAAYWLDQKMYTFTAQQTAETNIFTISRVFNDDTVFGFHDTLTMLYDMRRYLVYKNTCFKRK